MVRSGIGWRAESRFAMGCYESWQSTRQELVTWRTLVMWQDESRGKMSHVEELRDPRSVIKISRIPKSLKVHISRLLSRLR